MRKLKVGVLLALFGGVLSVPAQAATIYVGANEGGFNGAPTTNVAVLEGLTFSQDLTPDSIPGGFAVITDASGFAAIGGDGNNLGLFTLVTTGDLDVYSGATFTLDTFFFVPPGTTPFPDSTSATLTGTVIVNGNGVRIDFDNTPQLFLSPVSSNFTLVIDDVNVTAGAPAAQITGYIQEVPEPASAALFGLALAGLGAIRRRNAVA